MLMPISKPIYFPYLDINSRNLFLMAYQFLLAKLWRLGPFFNCGALIFLLQYYKLLKLFIFSVIWFTSMHKIKYTREKCTSGRLVHKDFRWFINCLIYLFGNTVRGWHFLQNMIIWGLCFCRCFTMYKMMIEKIKKDICVGH